MESTLLASTPGVVVQCSLAAGIFLLLRSYVNRRRESLPPGPKGLPLVGNIFQMPKIFPWKSFSEWSKTYGSIIHLNMIGQPIIVINSRNVARDLLDRRSNMYSDRPRLEIISMYALVGWDKSLVLLPYGDEWRQQRKLIVQDLAPSSCPQYYSLQERETRLLVRNILKEPSSLVPELRLRVGIIVVRTTYGHYVQSVDDPLLANGLQTIHDGSIAAEPGRFLVDFIPWLQYLPPWLPGTGFLQTAKKWKNTFDDATWKPIEFCRDNLHTGKMLMPNLCGNVYQQAGWEIDPDVERQMALAAATILGGGLDSSISTAMTFFLYMILKPEVQKKAQVELDRVVGHDRLPSITDRPDLPYLRSIMTEVYRISPPFPLSIPHTSTQDDIYDGVLIPKGSMILPNVWHMLHNPEEYPNPEEFMPERYNGKDSEMEKVKDVVFGFGRRVCPGNHFAEGTFFSIIATTLATCDILPGLDENGKVKMPDPNAYTSTTISFPKEFPVGLRARSSQAATLLAEVSETIE
ncbi:putative monooxygenase [Panaeolus papilionaceus]|nr:putative monooxygenase [Panaeolus papilionaceus]